MSNKVRCCYHCDRRTETCHSTCKDYIAEKPKYTPKGENVVYGYYSAKYAKIAHRNSRKTKRK